MIENDGNGVASQAELISLEMRWAEGWNSIRSEEENLGNEIVLKTKLLVVVMPPLLNLKTSIENWIFFFFAYLKNSFSFDSRAFWRIAPPHLTTLTVNSARVSMDSDFLMPRLSFIG